MLYLWIEFHIIQIESTGCCLTRWWWQEWSAIPSGGSYWAVREQRLNWWAGRRPFNWSWGRPPAGAPGCWAASCRTRFRPRTRPAGRTSSRRRASLRRSTCPRSGWVARWRLNSLRWPAAAPGGLCRWSTNGCWCPRSSSTTCLCLCVGSWIRCTWSPVRILHWSPRLYSPSGILFRISSQVL